MEGVSDSNWECERGFVSLLAPIKNKLESNLGLWLEKYLPPNSFKTQVLPRSLDWELMSRLLAGTKSIVEDGQECSIHLSTFFVLSTISVRVGSVGKVSMPSQTVILMHEST